MHHPAYINHLNKEYELNHLRQINKSFSWNNSDGDNLNFSVLIRYSNHCYTEILDDCPTTDDPIFTELNKQRIFDIERYTHSIHLPQIIEDLINKPTSKIALTYENNCYVYKMDMPDGLNKGEKYCIFFHLKLIEMGNPIRLKMYIESAYTRSSKVAVKQILSFGNFAMNLI